MVVVVVLPDHFRGMGAWRNSTETKQSGHATRSGPEVNDGRSSAKDGALLKRLGCGTIQEEVSQILQRVSAGDARRILLRGAQPSGRPQSSGEFSYRYCTRFLY